LFPVNLVI